MDNQTLNNYYAWLRKEFAKYEAQNNKAACLGISNALAYLDEYGENELHILIGGSGGGC